MLAQVYKHGSSVEFFMLDQETAARVQVASRVTTLRCEYSDLAAKLMNKESSIQQKPCRSSPVDREFRVLLRCCSEKPTS